MPIELAVDTCPFCHSGKLEVQDIITYPESDTPAMELTQTLFTTKMHCVVCQSCGTCGPVAYSAEAAVELWNSR